MKLFKLKGNKVYFGVCWLYALLFLAGVTFSLHSQQMVSSTNQDLLYPQFKDFLSAKRPPIAYVELTRSSFFYSIKGKPLSNDVEYVASLQPDTYYIKEIGTLFEPGTTKYTVSGSSYLDTWYINENGQVTKLSRDPHISGTNAPPNKNILERMSLLEDALSFGIFLLDRKSVSWINNNFKAQTIMPEKYGEIFGHISGSDGVRPDCLEYKFLNKKDITYKVTYEFNNDGKRPDWMPYKTILSIRSPKFNDLQNSLLITNTIEKLIVGLTNLGPTGYAYQSFLPDGDEVTNGNLVVYSNGISYVLAGNHFEKVGSPATAIFANPAKLKIARVFFFIFIILNLLGFGWYAARSRSNK